MPEDMTYTLAHPIYLDVPMMMSFLAHLEGGVSISETETTTAAGARERMLKGRGGFRAKLWAIGDAELGAEAGQTNRQESASESKTERHHTAASLFNVLYAYLRDDGKILDLVDEEGLRSVRPGQIVEVDGEYLGNPIEDVLAFFGSILPYLAGEEGEAKKQPKPSGKSGNPAKRAASAANSASGADAGTRDNAEVLKLMGQMAADIETAPVHDLLFQPASDVRAVVTAAAEYYSSDINEHLRAGQFRVVGKVTRVLGQGQHINLTRRTVLGAAGPEMAEQILSGMAGAEGLALSIAQPIVTAPAVQILPMAIFI